MVVKGRRANAKNPPVLSHEFVIQNHADIVACVAMVFVVGLMFQVSSPMASLFIALHHNVTLPVQVPMPGGSATTVDMVFYTPGIKDVPAIFFYLLIAIVMHQIIQEYLLDKINRKLHLSKVKNAKFNESGQLLAFYLLSIFWAGDIIVREQLFNIRSLWEGYPHVHMTFMFKFFFVVQMAYWVHIFPELYFQRVKREDMGAKIQYACLYLAFIVGAYVFSYGRVGLLLLVVQYVVEALFHTCRLLSYADKAEAARPLYSLHDTLFVLGRLASIALTVLTFWYGLSLTPKEDQVIDVAKGNFNSSLFRLNAMVAICLLQAWLMWNFINFHLRRKRENKGAAGGAGSNMATRSKNKQQEKAQKRRDRKTNDDLPEVDQAADLRQRVK